MDGSSSELKAVVHHLLSAIVEDPSAVDVAESLDSGLHNLTAYVEENDFSRLTERGGRTLRALETVVIALARKHKIDVTLEVVGRSNTTN